MKEKNFDGRLSFAEFMGEETPLEKLFKSMDKDGDGTVTKEVFVITIIINIVTYYKDGDGTVTIEVKILDRGLGTSGRGFSRIEEPEFVILFRSSAAYARI